jgi:transcriptional regulator of acetoin/glycerol metabolism
MAMSPRHSVAARRGDLIAPPAASVLPGDPAHLQRIEQSHLRCATQGLSRIESLDLARLPRADLAMARDRNQRLFTHAAPVMDLLFEQIVNTQSMVVLTDARGTILHAVGDDDFLERAAKVALAPGVNWSEPSKGTNAIGTALVDELPTLVHADEHYLHANHFLTCSATPIVDPRGHVLGVLDVTGDHRSYHRHTMGLVKMSARMIENHWLADDFRHVLRLHFHTRPEYLGTLMEGIVAVGDDGRCLGANRSAQELLQLSALALRMHPVQALFGLSVGDAIDLARRPLPVPMTITRPGGTVLHVQSHYGRPVQREAALPAAPPAAVAASLAPAGPAPLGLEDFDTGDARMHTVVHQLKLLLDSTAVPLLFCGETGTGKEWLAHAVHHASRRREQPWQVLRCAALAPAQLEAGLQAALSRAEGGSLLLDDIDALPLTLQGRLVHGLCGDPDRAVFATTRCDLHALVREGRFRDELLFRVEGLALQLPPLRQRSDIVAVARRMLARVGGARRPPALGQALQELLKQLAWPGNLHQLAHALQVAVQLAGDAEVLLPGHLPTSLQEEARQQAPQQQPPGAQATLHDLEMASVHAALEQAHGNVSEAARRLGVSRNTIYRKLRDTPERRREDPRPRRT